MSHRTLLLFAGLTLGDYLLWNWSLNANHEVIALVSGLTLPPLALLCAWRIVVAVGGLLARRASRPAVSATRAGGAPAARAHDEAALPKAGQPAVQQAAPSGSARPGSRKIAA